MITTIAIAAHLTNIPAGTIRRWLAEGRLCKLGDRKPYKVRLAEVEELRALLASDPTCEQ